MNHAGLLLLAGLLTAGIEEPRDIGDRLELFVDDYLIDQMDGVEYRLHEPTLASEGAAPSGHYATIMLDDGLYRWYYRTSRADGPDGNTGEVTRYAESHDGIHWTEPQLGLMEIDGSLDNNAILANTQYLAHNFTPLIDRRPDVPKEERYKALAGIHEGGGLYAFISSDGIHWSKLQEEPVLVSQDFAFDSQNVAFWSEVEGCYVCYFRHWDTPYGNLRTIRKTTSTDFVHWSAPVPMNPNLPGEHLYTSGTHPYFRAPHIYIALPTRFMPDRGSSTDILFMAARGGGPYARLFKEAFIRPGLDPTRWGNRANYAAWGVVPTGPAEMSIYVIGRRFTLRTDGFISMHAGVDKGECTTHPVVFSGSTLTLNYATSAAGSIKVQLGDENGQAYSGYSMDDAVELIGDSIQQTVNWKNGPDVSSLAGKPVCIRFSMQEADLYALQFTP